MYGDWIRSFKNYYIQDRTSTYGLKPSSFIDVSEKAMDDVKIVEYFEILPEGCQAHVVGERYPIRGNTPNDHVVTLTQYKKIVPMLIWFLLGQNDSKTTFTKKNVFQKIFIVLAILQFQEFFINWIWYGLQDLYFTDIKRYGQPVREMYRVIKHEKIRDIFCALIEKDTAYRYRFQDIATELDKKAFNVNPYREIRRLYDILRSREYDPTDDQKVLGMHKFKNVIGLVLLYLRFKPKLVNELKRIVNDVNVDEVKLSIEDIYWTNRYPDYNFRGINLETRLQEYENLKNGH